MCISEFIKYILNENGILLTLYTLLVYAGFLLSHLITIKFESEWNRLTEVQLW